MRLMSPWFLLAGRGTQDCTSQTVCLSHEWLKNDQRRDRCTYRWVIYSTCYIFYILCTSSKFIAVLKQTVFMCVYMSPDSGSLAPPQWYGPPSSRSRERGTRDHIYIHTCMKACMHASIQCHSIPFHSITLHTYIHTHTDIHTYLPTYIHTYLHT